MARVIHSAKYKRPPATVIFNPHHPIRRPCLGGGGGGSGSGGSGGGGVQQRARGALARAYVA